MSGTSESAASPAFGEDFLPPLQKSNAKFQTIFKEINQIYLLFGFASVNFWNKSFVGGAGPRMRVLTTLTGLAAAVLTPGIRSLACSGRYLWTSLWVQPMCIISLVSVSNLA